MTCDIVQTALLYQYYCSEHIIKFFADHSMYLNFFNVNLKCAVIYIYIYIYYIECDNNNNCQSR